MSFARPDVTRPSDWRRWLPGLATLARYEPGWLVSDITAGLVLTTALAPVGIAYAVASGLPGVYGLYATIAPLLAYALFGPSRILVLGPDSALAAVILGVTAPLAAGDPSRAVALAGTMALVAGAVCILAGLLKLGFVTELLSKPIRYGYMNGIALAVIMSQAPGLLGVRIEQSGVFNEARELTLDLAGGRFNWVEMALGCASLAAILTLRRIKAAVGVLVAIIAGIAVVKFFDLQALADVATLGPMPGGLPHFAIPSIDRQSLATAATGGVAVALVAFADTSVLSRAYAARLKVPVDPNQEMIGLGVANLAAGFFQGFPISSSSSRTPIAEAAGARTQLAGVVGAAGVAFLLVAAPRLLESLPKAALSAVVIASAIGLIEVADLKRIYRLQAWEFWLSMLCLAGVAAFGAILGIGLAVVVAIIEFLWDGWRPHSAVLGETPGVRGYHDVSRHPDARQVAGLLIFRWDAPLFFANAEFFRESVLHAAAEAPTKPVWLVVAAEPVTSVDVTAADALAELDDRLRESGIKLSFAEIKGPVKDKLRRFGLYDRIGEAYFFATVGAAVDRYRAMHAP